ncbi:MAG: c-type cytochrome [Myxococcota bacterium]|mgnify:CR=1 FL=1
MRIRKTLLLALLPGALAVAQTRGERVYGLYCATCHGARGDGEGPTAARYGSPAPRNFTRGVFRFRSTLSGQLPLHRDLVSTIERGLPGTIMPPWKELLPPRDIDEVARFIEGFSSRFAAEPEASRTAITILAARPDSAESVARGRFVYLVMKCWDCHGVAGDGGGPSAHTLKNEEGAALRATDFTHGVFKGGGHAREIYRALVTGLDGAAMPSYLQSTIVTREAVSSLAQLPSDVSAAERAALRRFLEAQPTAQAYFALDEQAQARMAEAWRWDLVHYVRGLARPSLWRRLVGLEPALAGGGQ